MTNDPSAQPLWRRLLPLSVVGLLIGMLKAESLADPNVLWGTRDGLTILSSGRLPRADAWSWTVPGKKWIPNSWGWDVILGSLQRLGGGSALAALNVVLILALVLGMGLPALRRGGSSLAVLSTMAVLGAPIMLPWVNDRPQLISYVFILLILPTVRLAMTGTRRRFGASLAAMLLGQVVWINLHFFGIVGPLLVAVAGLGLVAERWHGARPGRGALREPSLRLVAAVLVTAAATSVTPYGPIVAAKTLAVRSDAVGLIEEWQPAGFATYSQFTAVLAIAVAVIAAVSAWRSRRWDTVAVLAVLTIGAATACRIAPALAVVALTEFAVGIAPILSRRWARRIIRTATGLAFLIGMGVLVTGTGNLASLDPPSTSPTLLARLPSGCRLLNDYALGGAVIFARPDVKVAIDSRTDLYGRARMLANRGMVAGDVGAVQQVQASGVTCVLIPSGSGLVQELTGALGWQIAGADGMRTLLLRG